jgi:hypothetical protein
MHWCYRSSEAKVINMILHYSCECPLKNALPSSSSSSLPAAPLHSQTKIKPTLQSWWDGQCLWMWWRMVQVSQPFYFSEEFGPLFLPNPTTAVTKRRLYCMRLWARPVGFFFLSCLATLGVWPRTFPARAKDPCTLLMFAGGVRGRETTTETWRWWRWERASKVVRHTKKETHRKREKRARGMRFLGFSPW